MSTKTTRRCWMRLRAIPPIPFLIWVVARPRPALLPIIGPRRRGPGRIDGIRGHGTLLFGVRGSPTGQRIEDAKSGQRQPVIDAVADAPQDASYSRLKHRRPDRRAVASSSERPGRSYRADTARRSRQWAA